MPYHVIRADLTAFPCDAIVNAANVTLLGGGGVDGAIHRAAGPGLLAECRTLGGCEVGQAKRTKGYNLPCRYVIHTVGPVWRGGLFGEKKLLASCYQESLKLAAEAGCRSVAFPLISAGAYRFPRDKAIDIALEEIAAFLENHEMTVYLVLFDRDSVNAGKNRAQELREYIDDHYAQMHDEPRLSRAGLALQMDAAMPMASMEAVPAEAPKQRRAAKMSLEQELKQLDESFSQMLLRKIDEKGMKDSDCYKRAFVDRKLFSKIRGDVHYKPSKATAVAFAVALELPLWEARSLLQKAGFALSRSSKADVIIEFFISHGEYDILKINETLYAYDQPLLGG